VNENGSVAGTVMCARIQRPEATCQLVSPSMKTRGQNAVTASSVIAATLAMNRSMVARCRAVRARRGLKGSALEIERPPDLSGPDLSGPRVSTVRRAPRQAPIPAAGPLTPAAGPRRAAVRGAF